MRGEGEVVGILRAGHVSIVPFSSKNLVYLLDEMKLLESKGEKKEIAGCRLSSLV